MKLITNSPLSTRLLYVRREALSKQLGFLVLAVLLASGYALSSPGQFAFAEEDGSAEQSQSQSDEAAEETPEEPAESRKKAPSKEKQNNKDDVKEAAEPSPSESKAKPPEENDEQAAEDEKAKADEEAGAEVEIVDDSEEEEPEKTVEEESPPIVEEPVKKTPEEKKRVIGATATIMEKKSELLFRARVDSGAKSCSLHIEDMKIENESENMADNIGKVVSFNIKNGHKETHWLKAKIAGYVIIKTSNESDDRKRRYKVPLTFRYKDFEKTVLVTLNNREHMEFPLLLGRNFLKNDFVVDVDIDSSD